MQRRAGLEGPPRPYAALRLGARPGSLARGLQAPALIFCFSAAGQGGGWQEHVSVQHLLCVQAQRRAACLTFKNCGKHT